jgi:Domain of unknown function (DUF6378)
MRDVSILKEADDLINGQREKDYGDKEKNFQQIADGWNMVLKNKLQPGMFITPQDVALCMIQLKVARICTSYGHRDSIMDIAGYAGCLDIVNDKQNIYTNNILKPGEWVPVKDKDLFIRPLNTNNTR